MSQAPDSPPEARTAAVGGGSLRRLGQRLYVRIWLAVVLAVAVLTVLIGWAWRLAAEPPLRELVVRNEAGEVIGSTQRRLARPPPGGDFLGPFLPPEPRPAPPPGGTLEGRDGRADGRPLGKGLAHGFGNGPEFLVTLQDGQVLHIHLPRPPERSPFSRRPYGFFWMLAMVGVAVALGTYPIVRRLTKRLETLQQGVERWGQGDLSARIAIDGTDEVGHLATRFNHAAEQIETLMQSHKSLLANASHELRSPLARIRMGLELVRLPGAGGESAARQHTLEEISRNIGELDQLIDEILLASRLDARTADMGTVEEVDLTGLVAEECAHYGAQFELRAEHARSGSEADAPDLPPVHVQGVVKLLRRAVRNLLENARRYSKGEVRVMLQPRQNHYELRVCDQGPGVPPELRERIFEPFYRLPGASEQSGGVGLGLALVKSIAQRMGGSVRCEANPGGGACFVISLPQPGTR